MPITEYKIVTGANSQDLTSGIAAGSLAPIGDLVPTWDGSAAIQAAGVGTYDVVQVTNYEVVQGGSIAELEANVNAKIGSGLQPAGGVVRWQNAFIQVMGNVAAGGGGGGSVAWDDVTGKPTTFAPIVGTAANQAKPGNYTPPTATAAALGVVKVATDTVQTVNPETATATASRSYMVQKLASDQLVVNVPWVNYSLPVAGAAIGGVKIGAAVANAAEGTELATINALLVSLRASGAIAA